MPSTAPEPGYVTRIAGVRAVLQPIPSGVGPWLWAGELRTETDKPWRDTLRCAPYTEAGKARLLAVLSELAEAT